MRYISPIRFYHYCGIEDIQDAANASVTRLKKLVSTEFAMSDDGILSIDGFSYNKHDILSEIENPDWEKRLQYHLLVWNTKGLLKYLEEDSIRLYESRKDWLHFAKDKEFVKFVSPYFAESYSGIMKYFLNPVVFQNARDWLVYLVFVEEEHQEQALAPLRQFLDNAIRLLKNINKDTYRSKIDDVIPWTRNCDILINNLPPSLFHYKKDLAEAIINLTVEIQATDISTAFYLSGCLIQFQDLNPNLEKLVKDNHKIYDHIVNAKHNKTSGRSKIGSFFSNLFIIFIIIKFLMLMIKLLS